MNKPLYGVWAAQIGIERQLIVIWIQILANCSWQTGDYPDFDEAFEYWLKELRKTSIAQQRALGRILILEWYLQYGLDS